MSDGLIVRPATLEACAPIKARFRLAGVRRRRPAEGDDDVIAQHQEGRRAPGRVTWLLSPKAGPSRGHGCGKWPEVGAAAWGAEGRVPADRESVAT